MTDLRTAVTDDFTSHFEQSPEGVWSSPGRVNLIGEHTDYNGGFVLPFAIDRRTVAAVRRRSDRTVRVGSSLADELVTTTLDNLSEIGLEGWAAYPLGVAWALLETVDDTHDLAGFDLLIDSSVPVGAGLSSSAAIEAATGIALNDIWELGLDREALARAGQRAENVVVHAPTGIMDQWAVLFGTPDSAVYLDCARLTSEAVPLGFDEAGLTILVMDTRVTHSHSNGEYAARRTACESGAHELGVSSLREVTIDDLSEAARLLDPVTFRRVRHVVTENDRVRETVRTLESDGPTQIGALLNASHASLRDDFEVSIPELDLAVETALNEGALGARMTGGGFGGAAIALIPYDEVSRFRNTLDGAFAEHGYTVPEVFNVRASDGAHREW